ncbi:hypothetical protein [Salinilacihabitans rarus]|uniref:hypothetical protein n=1 Tax=Salinilacihabitans rarus TaxID=2961596 RepID=UPI0020C8C509|nr:hypothetical protein [Salinilacihabitans rarus]
MSGRPRSLDRRLRRVADRVGFALLWGWILSSLFFAPTLLGYWWVGALAFVAGLLVCWQAAAASTHPVYVIGTRREVDRARIADPGRTCDECGRSAEGGEYRRYAKRRVLFGTTVAVPEWGENAYCPACLDGESDGRRHAADESEGDATLVTDRSRPGP